MAPAARYRGTVEYETVNGLRDWGEGVTAGEQCEINVSGSDVALYQWDTIEQRSHRIDRVLDVTITEHPSFVEIRGVSEKLRSSPLRPSAAEMMVTLRLFPVGCQDCDEG